MQRESLQFFGGFLAFRTIDCFRARPVGRNPKTLQRTTTSGAIAIDPLGTIPAPRTLMCEEIEVKAHARISLRSLSCRALAGRTKNSAAVPSWVKCFRNVSCPRSTGEHSIPPSTSEGSLLFLYSASVS